MNILVTGADGQLGREIRDFVTKSIINGQPDHYVGEPNYYIFAGHKELDITDLDAVMKFVKDNYISVIVNCAAYTNVEKAQEDRNTARSVNIDGVENLSLAAQRNGAVLIHISTDYVLNADCKVNTPIPPAEPEELYGTVKEPYFPVGVEDCYYGYSKLQGEMRINCKHIVIRTSWLYAVEGKNFVNTMIDKVQKGEKVRVVCDQVGSPTYAGDLAAFIVHIIEDNSSATPYLSKEGTYNFSNKGVASWYDFAVAIFGAYRGISGIDNLVEPCRTGDFPSKVRRPVYSVLDAQKTEETFNFKISNWYSALLRVIGYKKLKENK